MHETSIDQKEVTTSTRQPSVRKEKILSSKETYLETYFSKRLDCTGDCWVDSGNSTQG